MASLLAGLLRLSSAGSPLVGHSYGGPISKPSSGLKELARTRRASRSGPTIEGNCRADVQGPLAATLPLHERALVHPIDVEEALREQPRPVLLHERVEVAQRGDHQAPRSAVDRDVVRQAVGLAGGAVACQR